MSENKVINSKIKATVWRHGYSCANVLASSYESILHSEPDPSLTIWGFLSCLYQSNMYKSIYNKTNCSNKIYVHTSVLLRTWLTAILLYGPHHKNLNLIISPFLKEKGHNDPDWYIHHENNPLDIKSQILLILQSLNSMMRIQNYLNNKRNKHAKLLKRYIEKLKKTTITLHFPPILPDINNAHNYTIHYTKGIRSITIKYKSNLWNSNIYKYDNIGLSSFEDEYINNLVSHFLNPKDFNYEKIVEWNDKSTHSLVQPWGDLTLPRKLQSMNGKHEFTKDDHQPNININPNIIIDSNSYIQPGNLHTFFESIIYALKNYNDDLYPNEYIDCLLKDLTVNVVCHGNIMKEFSTTNYNVENPNYLPYIQYTGTNGYSQAVAGNNWGMQLDIDIDIYQNHIVYPQNIKFYEGMINFIGDIYNIDCDSNCMTKKNAIETDAYYTNKSEKQITCFKNNNADFNTSLDLKNIYTQKKKSLRSHGGHKKHQFLRSRRNNNKFI